MGRARSEEQRGQDKEAERTDGEEWKEKEAGTTLDSTGGVKHVQFGVGWT